MEIEGTEHQLAFGFALASFFLSVQAIGGAVKRGDMAPAAASELFGAARMNLRDAGGLFPCDPSVKQIAHNLLLLVERMTAAYSAETPREGPH